MEIINQINNWIDQNKDYVLSTLSELVQINTENLPPTGYEKAGQEYLYNKIIDFIPEKNVDVFEIDDIPSIRENRLFFPTINSIQKIYKNRPNVVAKVEGKGDGNSLVFSGHMDVMPVYKKEWEIFKDPFSGQIKDGRMYGRGTADMKAGTIAGFLALKCLQDLRIELKGDVYAESVVDEENGGVNGTIAARLRNPGIDFAILSEPSSLIVGTESIGGSDWKVSLKERGPGGIGTETDLPNPIYKLSKVANMLDKYDKEILPIFRSPKNYDKEFKLRLLAYQIYSGGSTYSESGSVPIDGHLFFWLESFSYMNEEKYKKHFLDFMKKELSSYPEFKDSFPEFKTVIRFLGGHRTDTSHPAMSGIRKAFMDLGLKYEEKGLPFAMDAFAFREISKTEVVVIGPIGGNLHGIDEYVEIDSFLKLIKIMILSAIYYCGK